MTTTDYDVIICGGGPVGLLLACELRLADVSVAVLERLEAPDPTIKAGAINIPTGEALYRRGMLPEIQAAQDRNFARFQPPAKPATGGDAPPKTPPKFAGHFAGVMMLGEYLDDSDPDFTGHGPVDKIGLVSQQDIEAMLGDRAKSLGVPVFRNVEVTGLADDGKTVTVDTTDGPYRSQWLVGCDGGRSTVRKHADFDFPGTDPEITGHQAIVDLEGAENLKRGWNTTATGIYAFGPYPGRILTVELDGPPPDRDTPITAEELQASLRNVSGADVTVTAVHTATRFTDNARQVTDYRHGRILLAGDAAHVHSPFGGQGLNLGIGDAMNLGWKLAATIHGWAPPGLLDTYTTERHPIGAWVLDWSRAQVALMRTDPQSRALRQVMTDLLFTTTGTTHMVKMISGVWQRYDLPGDHDLIGRSAPDLALSDGTRLADHLHDGRALLLDLADSPEIRQAATGYGDRVTTVTAGCDDVADLAGLLLRPDGIVAWAHDDPSALATALSTWLGAPSA